MDRTIIDAEGENTSAQAADVPRARPQQEAGWIVPKHGHGALRPFTSGTGAVARRSSIRAARKESLALLAAATPEATERLIELMRSTDHRVATIASQEIMNRVHGRIGEPPPDSEGNGAGSSFSPRHLSPDERVRLSAALATIAELAAVAREREEGAAP